MDHDHPTMSPTTWTTDDGEVLTLRHIGPDDVDALSSFVHGLSFGARYFRFGRGDVEFTETEIRRTCTPDPQHCVHLLVVRRGEPQDAVVGSERIVFEPGERSCELAISVADDWQTRGVGKRLVDALLDSARSRQLAHVHARIMATNLAMIEFMQRRGFTVADSPQGPGLKVATIEV